MHHRTKCRSPPQKYNRGRCYNLQHTMLYYKRYNPPSAIRKKKQPACNSQNPTSSHFPLLDTALMAALYTVTFGAKSAPPPPPPPSAPAAASALSRASTAKASRHLPSFPRAFIAATASAAGAESDGTGGRGGGGGGCSIEAELDEEEEEDATAAAAAAATATA